jgi:phosphoglycolate phosphatase-like HAD superfamily hydrolase
MKFKPNWKAFIFDMDGTLVDNMKSTPKLGGALESLIHSMSR